MSMMSSLSWNTTPICSPKLAIARCRCGVAPAIFEPNNAEVAIKEPVLSATTRR
jgi:hypothetical protein